jgi:hypothetical protein
VNNPGHAGNSPRAVIALMSSDGRFWFGTATKQTRWKTGLAFDDRTLRRFWKHAHKLNLTISALLSLIPGGPLGVKGRAARARREGTRATRRRLPGGHCVPKTSPFYGESAVVRIRTADHPINSRGLYQTELRRLARPYKRAAQIVSETQSPHRALRNGAVEFRGVPWRVSGRR